ncbi:MAG: ABC transporter ATP-binding protein, partial [Gemmatimonadaceae bacterium]|nr:ABC transporter ATP-binding protein [Gemmatimonadaceae bacterium]
MRYPAVRFARNYAILRYAIREWPRLLVLIGLNAVAALVAALQPWPMKLLVDYALQHAKGSPLPAIVRPFVLALSPVALVVAAAVATVAMFALNTLLSNAVSWAWAVAGQRMVYGVAADVFRRLQRVSLLLHTQRKVGDSLTLLTHDVWGVYTMCEAVLIGPARHLLTVVAIGLVAWRLDPGLTLLSLTIIPALAATARFFGPRLLKKARGNRELQAKLFSFMQQNLSALPMVQAFGTETRNNFEFGRLADLGVLQLRRNALLKSWYSTVSGIIPSIGVAVVLYAGGQRVLAGTLSLGSLLVFLAYLRTMQEALRGLLHNYSSLRTVEASIERLMEVLDADDMIREVPGAPALPARGASEGSNISLEGVVFGYEPGR